MATAQLMTAEELAQLPDEGCRYELMRGELQQTPPTGGRHGRIETELTLELGSWNRQHGLGQFYTSDTGFMSRDPDIVLAPDLAFISKDRVSAGAEEIGFLEVVPDFVVEVMSPSDRSRSIIAKVHEYLDAGVQLLWLVDPQQETVSVYSPESPPITLTGDAELDGGEVLPGLRLPLRDIFRPAGQ
ncbi:MAG: Uma2 family endonuclease [Chloroflexota bacterium]